MTTVPNWLVWLSYIGGGLVALTMVWKVVKSFAKAFHNLRVVVAELQPNGGASLRDAVNKIAADATMAASKAEVAVSVAEETRREARAAASDARVAATEARAAVTQATEATSIASKTKDGLLILEATVATLVKSWEENSRILHELRGHAQASAIVVAPVVPKSPDDRRI